MKKLLIGLLALGSISSFAINTRSAQSTTCLLMDAVKVNFSNGYSTVKFSNEQKKIISDKGYSLVPIKGKQQTSRYLRNLDRTLRMYNGKLFLILERSSTDNSFGDNSCSFPKSCTNYDNSLILNGTVNGNIKIKDFGTVYSQDKLVEVDQVNQRILDEIQSLKTEAINKETTISRQKDIIKKIKELKASYDNSLDIVSQAKVSWLDKIVTALPNCEEIY